MERLFVILVPSRFAGLADNRAASESRPSPTHSCRLQAQSEVRFYARRKIIVTLLAGTVVVANAAAVEFKASPDWLKLPEGRDKIGNMHGDVAVSSRGEVFVSVQDPDAGLQVYAPDGKFLRNVPNAPSDLHGFVIRRQPDGEFLRQ